MPTVPSITRVFFKFLVHSGSSRYRPHAPKSAGAFDDKRSKHAQCVVRSSRLRDQGVLDTREESMQNASSGEHGVESLIDRSKVWGVVGKPSQLCLGFTFPSTQSQSRLFMGGRHGFADRLHSHRACTAQDLACHSFKLLVQSLCAARMPSTALTQEAKYSKRGGGGPHSRELQATVQSGVKSAKAPQRLISLLPPVRFLPAPGGTSGSWSSSVLDERSSVSCSQFLAMEGRPTAELAGGPGKLGRLEG